MAEKAPKTGAPGTAWNDPKTPGLRLRHLQSKSVWYLYYRTKQGKQRNEKLADERVLTLTAARERAREILAEVAKGGDPAGEKKALTERPTLADLAKDHYEKHCLVRNKPSWASEVESMYRVHILPFLGAETAVADVTEADVNKLHHHMRKTPRRANTVCAVLSKGMELSEKWGWRPKRSNPVDIDRYKENERSRIPDENEAARLLKALERASEEEPHFVGLVELLLFTGARLGEIKAAKWEWVTQDGLELPDSKTGKKTIPLSDLARNALQNIPRVKGNPYIIVGRRKGRHMVNVTKPWNRLMEAAQIKERLVRHDLRHFFATAGLSGGLNLDQLGELLGHADPRTTKCYAKLMVDSKQQAANTSAKAVQAFMARQKNKAANENSQNQANNAGSM